MLFCFPLMMIRPMSMSAADDLRCKCIKAWFLLVRSHLLNDTFPYLVEEYTCHVVLVQYLAACSSSVQGTGIVKTTAIPMY